MLIKVFIAFFLSLYVSATASLPRDVVVSKIRVRLAEAIPKVSVRGFDLKIYETSQQKLANYSDRVSEWELGCQDGRIRATSVANGKTLDLNEPVTINTPAGFLTFRNYPYRDLLRIYSVGSFCEVVNEVDLEKYLDGLVNSEFSAKWSEEAIAAQVIAARTYAVYQIRQARQNPKNHFDVDATIKDQVYDGSMREDFRASRSVERTRGMVLVATSKKGLQPIKAFYHSTCGGVTELPEKVWGQSHHGFKNNVTCPHCGASPAFRWELDIKETDLVEAILRGISDTEAFKKARQVVKQGKLIDLKIQKKDHSGRVAELQSVWADGKQGFVLPIAGSKFRDLMGTTKLRSTAFDLTYHRSKDNKRWYFKGQGNGHGVGMCQWGAKTMAEKGHKTAAILKFYYPNASLQKLW